MSDTKEKKISSIIKEIKYDSLSHNLKITFTNDQEYLYENVPQSVVDEWERSESKGKFFLKEVKGCYDFKKLSK